MKINKTDIRYRSWMDEISRICAKLDICAYKPDYHGKENDAGTLLFYTKEAMEYNARVDAENYGWAPQLYEPYICTLEFTDVNGHFDFGWANRGKLDLRGSDGAARLEGYVRCQYAIYLQEKYVASHGGIENIREADNEYNEYTRSIAAAFAQWYPDARFGKINYYGSEREIARGAMSVFHEHPAEGLQAFQYSFCVPKANTSLERQIIEWNCDGSLNSEAYQKSAQIVSDILRAGGILLDWR